MSIGTPARPAIDGSGRRPQVLELDHIVVPEHREKSTARTITIPIRHLPASDPHPDRIPVFRLGGGPGMSNLKFRPASRLAASRDIVLLGYRGVDGSTKLDCPEVTRALRHTHGDVLGVESRERVAAAAAASAARIARQGVDLAGYTVAEVVADIDDARAALGYERIHLLSESYGTRLALLYAQQHPEHVGRSVLIGVNPPGRFVWDPDVVDSQLADWGALWASAGPNHDADLAGAIRRAGPRLPRRWLGFRIDPGKAKIVTFVMLFQRRTGLIAIDAWQAAADGDPSGVALLSIAYELFVPTSFTWGDFLAKALSVDFEPERDYAAWLDAPAAALGSPLSLLFFGSGTGWPVAPAPEAICKLASHRVESLLISGALDVSTPPQTARDEALPFLQRGTQVVIPNASHVDDMWQLQPDAMQSLVTTFLDDGDVVDTFDAATPDVRVPVRLPTIATGAACAVRAAVAVGMVVTARRLRR